MKAVRQIPQVHPRHHRDEQLNVDQDRPMTKQTPREPKLTLLRIARNAVSDRPIRIVTLVKREEARRLAGIVPGPQQVQPVRVIDDVQIPFELSALCSNRSNGGRSWRVLEEESRRLQESFTRRTMKVVSEAPSRSALRVRQPGSDKRPYRSTVEVTHAPRHEPRVGQRIRRCARGRVVRGQHGLPHTTQRGVNRRPLSPGAGRTLGGNPQGATAVGESAEPDPHAPDHSVVRRRRRLPTRRNGAPAPARYERAHSQQENGKIIRGLSGRVAHLLRGCVSRIVAKLKRRESLRGVAREQPHARPPGAPRGAGGRRAHRTPQPSA